jgi:hypothetical protein
MLLLWLENVLIGVFNVIKMLLTALRGGVLGFLGGLFFAAFFTVHYGLFCFAHGGIVLVLFSDTKGREASAVFDMVVAASSEPAFIAALLTLLGMQLIDLLGWMHGPRPARADALMVAPYGRVAVLHISLLFGAMLIDRFGTPVAGILLLIALKLAADLFGVLATRRRRLLPAAGERRIVLLRRPRP